MRAYEQRHEPLAPRRAFFKRLLRSWLLALVVIAAGLGVGVWGYHGFEHLSYADAFVNAAMILSGMGPVNPINTEAGKIFAGCYALFSGLAFTAVLGFVMLPIAHRLLHKFHLDRKNGA